METLCEAWVTAALSNRNGDGRGRSRAAARKRESVRQPLPAHSVKTRRSVVECTQSGAARYCREIRFHRWRVVRPLSLTDWIAAGLKFIPGKLLWFSSGIHPA